MLTQFFSTSRRTLLGRGSAIRSFAAAQPGTVKFYLRDKGYGFIQPDSSPDTDVFVHRNMLLCSHQIPQEIMDSSIRYPYLKQTERVMFEMEYDDSGMRRAKNVTWLNGNKIPPERVNYLGGVHERAKYTLGDTVYTMLLDEDGTDKDTLITKILAEFNAARTAISNGEEVVRRLGMSPSEFPTAKTTTGRGRYIFDGESVDEKLTQGDMNASPVPPSVEKDEDAEAKQMLEALTFSSMADESPSKPGTSGGV